MIPIPSYCLNCCREIDIATVGFVEQDGFIVCAYCTPSVIPKLVEQALKLPISDKQRQIVEEQMRRRTWKTCQVCSHRIPEGEELSYAAGECYCSQCDPFAK